MLIFSKAIGKYFSLALLRTNYFRFDFLNKSPENSMFLCLYDKYYKQEKCYFRSDFKITKLLRQALRAHLLFQLLIVALSVSNFCNQHKKVCGFHNIFSRSFKI